MASLLVLDSPADQELILMKVITKYPQGISITDLKKVAGMKTLASLQKILKQMESENKVKSVLRYHHEMKEERKVYFLYNIVIPDDPSFKERPWWFHGHFNEREFNCLVQICCDILLKKALSAGLLQGDPVNVEASFMTSQEIHDNFLRIQRYIPKLLATDIQFFLENLIEQKRVTMEESKGDEPFKRYRALEPLIHPGEVFRPYF